MNRTLPARELVLGLLVSSACIGNGPRGNSVEFSSLMDETALRTRHQKCRLQGDAMEALKTADGGLRLGRETADWAQLCVDHAIAEAVFGWLCSKAAVERPRCVDLVVFDGPSAWIELSGEQYRVVGLDKIRVPGAADAGSATLRLPVDRQ